MLKLTAPRLRPDRSFERLYRRHVASVHRYALAMLRNPADAEDVTQTTFLNAYRAYERGERPRAASSWLIAIAHNACRQRLRELQRRAGEVSLDEGSAISLEYDDDVPRAEDIRRALGSLAFNQRAALVMRELEGRPYAEIAEVLGLSTSAVETLIFRARRALREQLEGSLTCAEAELAILRQLDRRLPRSEKSYLRAHLRECPECSSLARRERGRRTALRSLTAIPLPSSLTSLFGGGGAAGGGLAVKGAAVLAAGAVLGGTGYQVVDREPWRAAEPTVSAAAPRAEPVVRRDAAPVRAAAPATLVVQVAAAPSSRHVVARVQPVVRTSTKSRAAKPTLRSAPATPVIERRATPAAPKHQPEQSEKRPAREAETKAKSPGAQGSPAIRVHPTGQTKAKPKPHATAAAERVAAKKAELVAAPKAPQAPSLPPGQATKDDATVVDAPPGQEKKADEAAATGAPELPPGQAKEK